MGDDIITYVLVNARDGQSAPSTNLRQQSTYYLVLFEDALHYTLVRTQYAVVLVPM